MVCKFTCHSQNVFLYLITVLQWSTAERTQARRRPEGSVYLRQLVHPLLPEWEMCISPSTDNKPRLHVPSKIKLSHSVKIKTVGFASLSLSLWNRVRYLTASKSTTYVKWDLISDCFRHHFFYIWHACPPSLFTDLGLPCPQRIHAMLP